MDRIMVCYKIEGRIFIDSKSDFKEIRFNEGFDKVKLLEEKLCQSKKSEVKFANDCRSKYYSL